VLVVVADNVQSLQNSKSTAASISDQLQMYLWKSHQLVEERRWTQTGLHSFIHFEDLDSAPSRNLLRSAPSSATAKENRLE